ncbi:MAG: 50S ribosomal protein L11 methyltransferase [Chloroflexi bacterium]|nr:50S ribosomal protein L11 methyltransferase [Chloroflexota bacterium]
MGIGGGRSRIRQDYTHSRPRGHRTLTDHLELTIAVQPQAVEAAADLLRRHAPAGVSIEPPFQALDEDGNVAFDSASPIQLRVWLPAGAPDRSLDALRRDLAELGDGVVQPLRVRTVQDDSWADNWKEHFHVMRIGRRIVLRPSWRTYEAQPDDIVVEIDPGQAFGTGQHATTRLCLEQIEQRLRPGDTVLDIGSGSGILSTTAALLGAAQVDAIDIDPAAVRSTRENAERNGVGALVHIAQGSLGNGWPFLEAAARRYDLVLANLSGRIVRELAQPLVASLATAGVALVSGIIDEQETACAEALVAAGGRVSERYAEDEWLLLAVTRR